MVSEPVFSENRGRSFLFFFSVAMHYLLLGFVLTISSRLTSQKSEIRVSTRNIGIVH